MRIYNSLSRKTEEFVPSEPGKVSMYVCGLTPYDHAHLGHVRTYAAFDMLKRHFMQNGYSVLHIQNITDVDDKILRRAKESKREPLQMASEFHSESVRLFRSIGILDASLYPKVTLHIREIIALTQKLIDTGFAYETETGVYFQVSKCKDYGALSGQKLDEIIAGSRKEVDETKRDPADFALWKKTKKDAVEFDSPWGRGRPGWHIECSAMAGKYAPKLDIHGGARDLMFPHHENEIAQSECAGYAPFSKYWMHTGFLTVNGEKMSKSLNNFITLKDALKDNSPGAIRLFFALAHYRSPIDYSPKQLVQAEATFARMKAFRVKVRDAIAGGEKPAADNPSFAREIHAKFMNFHKFLENDFDTPTAMTYVFSAMKSVNAHMEGPELDYAALSEAASESEKVFYLLGMDGMFGEERKPQAGITDALIRIITDLREAARKRKDYESSDQIRLRMSEIGISLEDKKGK
jgi:cysteinyl-tRNA synthetase